MDFIEIQGCAYAVERMIVNGQKQPQRPHYQLTGERGGRWYTVRHGDTIAGVHVTDRNGRLEVI